MSTVQTTRSVTVRKVRNRMIFFYTIVMLVVFFSIFTYAFKNFKQITNEEISKQVSSLDIQFMTAINYFTDNAENDCTKVFCDSDILSYDPIENDYAEYESASIKNDTKKRLLEISSGSSYNDFLIAFSDDSAVGKVSSGANDIIGKIGFDGIAEYLNGGSDAWIFGLSGNYRKIYYVRSISDHSIFMLSCYINDLDRIFTLDHADSSDTLYLTDSEGRVIYTNSTDIQSGEVLPEHVEGLFDFSDGDLVITENYIGASLETDCGWHTVTVIDAPTLIKISPITATAATALALILIFLSAATGIFACTKYIISDISDPNSEYTDPLTGTLNEYGLDEEISELMETAIVGSTYAFILIGVKDSRQIKSTVSMRCWNDIRISLARFTEDHFKDRKCYIGRVNDDQIAAFVDFSEFDIFKAHEALKTGCENFCKSFEDFTVGSENDLRLHISIGACIYPDHAEDFDDLLEKANEALKKADESDDDSCVIYDPAKAVKR